MHDEDLLEGMRLRTGDWGALGDQCTRIRDEVFVTEQSVPVALEHDGRDTVCVHVLACAANGEPIGTGRLLPDGHIGRMAVRRAWRGQGVGGAILALLVEEAREQGHPKVMLNAQTSALDFYSAFGFLPIGAQFIEAGIEHLAMELKLD